jgi:hypothetical protein
MAARKHFDILWLRRVDDPFGRLCGCRERRTQDLSGTTVADSPLGMPCREGTAQNRKRLRGFLFAHRYKESFCCEELLER